MDKLIEREIATRTPLVAAPALAVQFFLIPLAVHQGPTAFFFSLITFLEVVLLFNILIIVHELGHFLAAKWCGLKIDKFAIWFGKPLWSKKIDGVDYILGSIPAGGYVALPQMAGNLSATTDEIGWVATGYILSNVVVLPMTAFLTQMFGRRNYLTASIDRLRSPRS